MPDMKYRGFPCTAMGLDAIDRRSWRGGRAMGEAGIGKEAWSKTSFHHFLGRRIDYCESLGSNEWMHYFVARYCAGSHAGIRASRGTVTSREPPLPSPSRHLRVIIQSIRVSSRSPRFRDALPGDKYLWARNVSRANSKWKESSLPGRGTLLN